MIDEMRRLNEAKARKMKVHFNLQVDKKVGMIEDLNDMIQPKLERLKARKDLMPDAEYQSQLKSLMLLESEKRLEIQAKLAEDERDFQEALMKEFVEKQKEVLIALTAEMEDMKNSVLNSQALKDRILKPELDRLKSRYDD